MATVIRISDTEAKGVHPCFACGMFHVVEFKTAQELDIGMEKLKNDALIQDAFPQLSAGEREIFLSGACDKAFNSLFGEE